MQKEKLLIGQLSTEEIVKLKETHKSIIKIEAGEHVIYLREPEWEDMNIAQAMTDADHPLEYNRTLMAETKIGGSDEILNNPKLYVRASILYNKRLDKISASLEEL